MEGRKFFPIDWDPFVFILFSIFPGLSRDEAAYHGSSTTAALAVVTIIIVELAGIRKRGLALYQTFFQPTPFLFAQSAEELVKPVSLSLRLLPTCSGKGGSCCAAPVFPLFLPIPGCFRVIMGLIQALVFLLTVVYIATLVKGH